MLFTISIRKSNNIYIYFFGFLICIGLIARDILGIGVNKFIFLILAALPIVLFKLENVVTFSCFLIPLYVGLPGNFISACLLIRLLYEAIRKKIILNRTGFLLSISVAGYILLQNFITGYTGIYNIMFALDFITLDLLLSVIIQYKKSLYAYVGFALGNAVLGLIMLKASLAYFSLADLMNPTTRLGYTGVLIRLSGASMVTSIDPNFYAMNVIPIISVGCLFINRPISRFLKNLIIAAIIGCGACCLIGLSRTFIIVLAIWGILWIIDQKSFKSAIIAILIICAALFVFLNFLPTVSEGLITRFSISDVSGGNGRINLIIKYFEPWFSNLGYIFLGIGIFNCYTHCAPLLYLFGAGIIGAVVVFSWFLHQWNKFKNLSSSIRLTQYVPMIVTFICFSSIPAVGAINYSFPLLISFTALQVFERET